MKTVVGLFDKYGQAKDTYKELIDQDFDRQSISFITTDLEGARHLKGSFWQELFGTSDNMDLHEMDLPGIGRVAATGPLAGRLQDRSLGLVEILKDRGVPDQDAQLYAEWMRRGGSLVVVNTDEPADQRAVEIVQRHNPVDIGQRMGIIREKENWQQFNENAQPLTEEQRNNLKVPVIEEELRVGKRQVETGGTRIHTYVTEEQAREDVNLRSETVNVERHPADRPASPEDVDAFKEKTIEMKETTEEPVVSKEARVVEDVDINKNVDERTETVGDTVRKTNVDVENLGKSGRENTPDFGTLEPDFRRHYETHYANSNMGYNQIRAAYRFGAQEAQDSRFSDQDWAQIEPSLRQDWQVSHPDMDWTDVKEAVREGWEATR